MFSPTGGVSQQHPPTHGYSTGQHIINNVELRGAAKKKEPARRINDSFYLIRMLFYRNKTASNENIRLLQLQNLCSHLSPDLLKPFCYRAMGFNPGPNSCDIHQSCVCVYVQERVWSAVSALAILVPIHQPPDSSELKLCDIRGHFTSSSERERKKEKSRAVPRWMEGVQVRSWHSSFAHMTANASVHCQS